MSRAKKDTPPRFPEFRDAFLELMGDMTLDQFSKKLEMSRATVGFYAAGQRIPDALGLRKIAEKCNVSADWLLGLSETRSADIDVQKICKKTGLSEQSVSWLIFSTESAFDLMHKPSVQVSALNDLLGAPDTFHLLSYIEMLKHTKRMNSDMLHKVDDVRKEVEENPDGTPFNVDELLDAWHAPNLAKMEQQERLIRFETIDMFTKIIDGLYGATDFLPYYDLSQHVRETFKRLADFARSREDDGLADFIEGTGEWEDKEGGK